MIDSAKAIASCVEATSGQYEAITHNLANTSTVGYKRVQAVFMSAGADPSAPGGGSGSGIIGKSFIDFTQGNLIQTGRPLDMALRGPGFFVLETPKGQLYTRNGTFQTNAEGQLVDTAGRTVAGTNGPLIVPRNAATSSINVTSDGRLMAGGLEVGRLKIVEFEKPEVLKPVGQCAFEGPAKPAPAEATKTTVSQGYQEGSNVNAVDELVGLITASRLYEANIKAIQTSSERGKSVLAVAMG